MTPRTLMTAVQGLAMVTGLCVFMGAFVAPVAEASGATATFTKTQDWGTGWEGRYVITNSTSKRQGWSEAQATRCGTPSSSRRFPRRTGS